MRTIKLKKGLDIAISGAAEAIFAEQPAPAKVQIVPDYYEGMTPKVLVRQGDKVAVGSPILFDKNHPSCKVVSPVSGTVAEVVRGERRKLMSITIDVEGNEVYPNMPKFNVSDDVNATINTMFEAGFGALIRQRPYDVVASPEVAPKAIFVSAFDSAPLAPDYNFVLQGREKDIQDGLDVLARIAKVYYSVAPVTSKSLREMNNVEVTEFVGNHPAGNVGVQINHLCPVNKGETVWTMNIQDVANLGKFAATGVPTQERIIAVVGPQVKHPAYVRTVTGAAVADLVADNLNLNQTIRIINGNVLSGVKAEQNSALSPFAAQISVIAEGDHADELLGWAMPRLNKFSASNLFATKLQRLICPKKQFDFDARILGGERAFIMSGEYERVFPMDIMPEQLVKAMIARNIDKMEQLGAYEVAPEDFALCEFVCTSKIPTQQIVREALNYMRKELE